MAPGEGSFNKGKSFTISAVTEIQARMLKSVRRILRARPFIVSHHELEAEPLWLLKTAPPDRTRERRGAGEFLAGAAGEGDRAGQGIGAVVVAAQNQ
jgi:hypothetical protein